MAQGDEELKRLIDLAHFIEANLESEYQLDMFPAEELSEHAIRARQKQEPDEWRLPVNLKELREEQRVTVGIHDVHGVIYRDLGVAFE